jgi:hypothetical protein
MLLNYKPFMPVSLVGPVLTIGIYWYITCIMVERRYLVEAKTFWSLCKD